MSSSWDLSAQSVVGTLLRDTLREQLEAREQFTPVGPDDVEIDASLSGHNLTFSYAAKSPRGAVFLGELASVGFFGAEAQQLLSPV